MFNMNTALTKESVFSSSNVSGVLDKNSGLTANTMWNVLMQKSKFSNYSFQIKLKLEQSRYR